MDTNKPQNKTMLYAIGAALLAVVGYFLFFKKSGTTTTPVTPTPSGTQSNNTGVFGFCVNVPGYFQKWDGVAVVPTDAVMKEILGSDATETQKSIMIGFFKAAGIKVTDANALAMKAEIKQYMAKVPTPHWDIVENSLRCDTATTFARRLQ